MLAWLLMFGLVAQVDPCLAPVRPSGPSVEGLDLDRVVARIERESRAECVETRVATLYLRGLVAAQAAYALGGSAESLLPVRAANAALDAIAVGAPGSATIASLVLRAATAAAQSERDEMTLYLEQAVRLEAIELARAGAGLPVVTAHEAAGDLWLRVHRFDAARRAYAVAAERLGVTPRIVWGRARVAVRLNETSMACAEYGALAALVGRADSVDLSSRAMAEARAYLGRRECRRRGPSFGRGPR
jgi:hypothetical protein